MSRRIGLTLVAAGVVVGCVASRALDVPPAGAQRPAVDATARQWDDFPKAQMVRPFRVPWEHSCVTEQPEVLAQQIPKLGDVGWELVTYSPHEGRVTACFKRPK